MPKGFENNKFIDIFFVELVSLESVCLTFPNGFNRKCDQIIEWDDPGFSFANLVLVVIFTILLSVYENYVLWFSVYLGRGNLYLTSIAEGFSCFVQIKIGSAV